MNYDNLSQILNGLDYNERPAVKSMEKIREDGAATRHYGTQRTERRN